MKKLLLGLGFLLLAGASLPAFAQTFASQTVPGYYANAPQPGCTLGPCFIPYGSTLPVTASIAGFAPSGTVASLSGATSSSSVALPAGAVVSVTNTGANTLFYNLSIGAGTAATTDAALVAGASVGLTVGSNTFFNGITSTSTTTARLAGGTGLVTGYGGGSSSGGGGGAVTIADAADVTQGAKADAKSTATDTTAVTIMQVLKEISFMEQTPASRAVTNAGTFAVQVSGVSTAANQTNVQAVIGAATAPASMVVGGGVYNSTPLTLTNGQSSALQFDANGYLAVNIKTGASSGAVAQGSTTSGQTGLLIQGAVTTSAPTYTTAQTSPLSLDTAGSLRVNVTSATGVTQGSTTSGQTISPIGCRTLTSAPTDTTAQTNMPWCTPKGSLVFAQPTAADLNATVVGTGTFAVQSQPSPVTSGGLSISTLTAANSTNATNLKASAGQLYHFSGFNNSATLAWVSFYNTAGTPTCGTSIVWQEMLPANSTSGAGAVDDIASGLAFSTGIGYCVTTGIAGTGSVAASAYVVNFGYK